MPAPVFTILSAIITTRRFRQEPPKGSLMKKGKVLRSAPQPQEKGGASVSQKSKKVTITVPHALYEAVKDMARREDQSWHSMLLRLVRRGIIETKVLHERLGKEGRPIHSDICSMAGHDKEKG